MDGSGTTCEIAMPVASGPRALTVAGVPITDSAYSVTPRWRARNAFTNSSVGLPARPITMASRLPPASLAAALPASDALFSTVTAMAPGSLSRSMDCLAALKISLPKALFW
ncbi:hypothetical protein D3C72_1553870 [compost metagenome]